MVSIASSTAIFIYALLMGKPMVGRRGRVEHTPLPAGLHAILTYAVIIGVCYLFLIGIGWYDPELLSAVPVGLGVFFAFTFAVVAIVVANLKPAVIRGVESKGMLLAAEQGGKVRVLEARQCAAGESVFADKVTKQPAAEITIDQLLALGMRVGQGVPQWNGHPLRTKHAFLTVADVTDGNIR